MTETPELLDFDAEPNNTLLGVGGGSLLDSSLLYWLTHAWSSTSVGLVGVPAPARLLLDAALMLSKELAILSNTFCADFAIASSVDACAVVLDCGVIGLMPDCGVIGLTAVVLLFE